MADFVPKDLTGSLFKNDRKNKDTHPDYTGTVMVGGQEYWLSAWLKDGKRGKYMSLGLKLKEDAAQGRQPAPSGGGRQQSYAEALDDEIPF